MNKALNYIFPIIIAILAVAYTYEKCTPGPMVQDPVDKDTIVIIYHDTVFQDKVVYYPKPKHIYNVDTIVQNTLIIQHDTLRIRDLTSDTICNRVKMYQDSIVDHRSKLNYTIITQGDLLYFDPLITHYTEEKTIIRNKLPDFVFEPMAGFSLPEVKPAIGIKLGFRNYTGTYIRSGTENIFLTGYRITF